MSEGRGHGEKLSRKRSEVIAALLSCSTVGEAAAKVGVSERTVRRWLAKPDFARDYRAARRELVDAVLMALQRIGLRAVEALDRNLTAGKPAVEVRAAAAVLDRLIRLAEVVGLAEEVAELKRKIAESKP